jgi:2-hydroxy-6-oxonona-2,4-dienedioate hydrolase
VNARSLRDLMDTLGIERASIVGNSMGGGAGLTFAVDYPERLDKLIVMGAGSGAGVFTPTPTEGIKIIGETYREPTVENFGRLVRVMVYDSAFVTDALLEQRRQGALQNQTHLDNWIAGQRVPPRDIYSDLPKIRAKTLMMHGRNDRTVPLESGLLGFARIPGAQMHIFNECAHWAQLEKVDQFNRLVEDFLTHD